MPESKKSILTYVMPLLTATLLIALVVISFYRLYYQSSTITNDIIVDHVEELTRIFKEIDTTCHIIGFEHKKNYIDFLNVKLFEGSEVGSMNLGYPQAWKGPYVKQNPTIQEQFYVIIVAKDGYYIAPGDGIILADGKIIGTDVVLNEHTNFDTLMHEHGALFNNNQPLVRKFKDL